MGTKQKVEEEEIRRGPWAIEEDKLLIHYIACNGEGRWNLLANCSGLKRTGKSCRLRWLNYLKPDVKRGNLTPAEQILILELHSKWGNRWARIAQYLPGRTDNEIKNYWRTKVHKQAKHLKIDVNSSIFRDVVKYFWLPRLIQGMEMDSYPSLSASSPSQVNQCVNNPTGDTQQIRLGSQIQLSQIENTISCPNVWADPQESTHISHANQQICGMDTDCNFFLSDAPIDVSHMSRDGLEMIYPGTVASAEAPVISTRPESDSSSSIMMIKNNFMEDGDDYNLWMEYLDESWLPTTL